MSDNRSKNFKIYLRQILDKEIAIFIQFASSSQKSALKRGVIAIRDGQVSNSTVNRHVDKYIKSNSTKPELENLIQDLISRASKAEEKASSSNSEALKSGLDRLTLHLANENGRYNAVNFELLELDREQALEVIEISEFNAREAENLKPQDVAGIIKTLPKGQREPAWAYRANGKLYIFDGLRRFTAFKLCEDVKTFKLYVTEEAFSIFMYASYDNLSEDKLERTPYEQGKYWLALAEKDNLKITDQYSKDEKSTREEIRDFCQRFNIAYNTFLKYLRLLKLDSSWRKAMPFTSTLTIKQLENLLKLQIKCHEHNIDLNGLIASVATPDFDEESTNKTENSRANKKFIDALSSSIAQMVVDVESTEDVTRELYRNGDTVVQLKSTRDNKGRTVDTIVMKRFDKSTSQLLLREIEQTILKLTNNTK